MTIVRAELSRDTEKWGMMDPFVELKYRDLKLKTDEHTNSGKRPKWNKMFDLQVKSISDNLIFEVYDVNVFENQLIGAGIAKGKALCVDKI